jgi:hypothetical protein
VFADLVLSLLFLLSQLFPPQLVLFPQLFLLLLPLFLLLVAQLFLLSQLFPPLLGIHGLQLFDGGALGELQVALLLLLSAHLLHHLLTCRNNIRDQWLQVPTAYATASFIWCFFLLRLHSTTRLTNKGNNEKEKKKFWLIRELREDI